MSKHASIPFNPDVASVFFRAGMIESSGRGIERILEACREAHTPAPDLRYEHTGLWWSFVFYRAHAGDHPRSDRGSRATGAGPWRASDPSRVSRRPGAIDNTQGPSTQTMSVQVLQGPERDRVTAHAGGRLKT